MIDILSPAGRVVLADMARQRLVVALDFDGTLAPLVGQRDEARMRDTTRGLLRVVSLLYPCAVISGRARADVARRLGPASLAMVVGNGGAESSSSAPPEFVRARVRTWADELRASIGAEDVDVEDKGFSLALHYRRSSRKDHVRARLWVLALALPGAKVVGGHAVVNVFPSDAPSKGDAVEAFAASFRGRPVAYVGDDHIDEDAFRSQAVTLGIRVGKDSASAARYFLRAQEDIDLLLRELIGMRMREDGVIADWADALSRNGGGKT